MELPLTRVEEFYDNEMLHDYPTNESVKPGWGGEFDNYSEYVLLNSHTIRSTL